MVKPANITSNKNVTKTVISITDVISLLYHTLRYKANLPNGREQGSHQGDILYPMVLSQKGMKAQAVEFSRLLQPPRSDPANPRFDPRCRVTVLMPLDRAIAHSL